MTVGDDVVQWKYVEEFYKADSSMPMRLCPKLTSKHFDPTNFSKMKVSYAVQVLRHTTSAGMLAYIGVNGGSAPSTAATVPAVAVSDEYDAVLSGQTITVADPSKGLIANDTNVYGVSVANTLCSGTPPATPTASCSPAGGMLNLNKNGTFT